MQTRGAGSLRLRWLLRQRRFRWSTGLWQYWFSIRASIEWNRRPLLRPPVLTVGKIYRGPLPGGTDVSRQLMGRLFEKGDNPYAYPKSKDWRKYQPAGESAYRAAFSDPAPLFASCRALSEPNPTVCIHNLPVLSDDRYDAPRFPAPLPIWIPVFSGCKGSVFPKEPVGPDGPAAGVSLRGALERSFSAAAGLPDFKAESASRPALQLGLLLLPVCPFFQGRSISVLADYGMQNETGASNRSVWPVGAPDCVLGFGLPGQNPGPGTVLTYSAQRSICFRKWGSSVTTRTGLL